MYAVWRLWRWRLGVSAAERTPKECMVVAFGCLQCGGCVCSCVGCVVGYSYNLELFWGCFEQVKESCWSRFFKFAIRVKLCVLRAF